MQISVNFGTDIMYVGGTVNGADTLFEGDGHIFFATVAQSPDNKYVLELQLVDEAGNTTDYSGIVDYALPFFVYDRTQEDVDRAIYLNQKYISGTITDEEKAEWQSDLKGALNASDLNRIEGNIAELANAIAKEVLSFKVESIVTKQWSGAGLPRVSDFLRIRNNVKALRDAWYTTDGAPDTPEPPLNYFEKINDIEHILHDLYTAYVNTIRSYDYCGEFYAGEEVGYI